MKAIRPGVTGPANPPRLRYRNVRTVISQRRISVKNKLSDLNNHLFAEIERLGNEELRGEELRDEISKAHAISNIAAQIVANGNLVYKAHMAAVEWESMSKKKVPEMLE
jgi:hypothetical protein